MVRLRPRALSQRAAASPAAPAPTITTRLEARACLIAPAELPMPQCGHGLSVGPLSEERCVAQTLWTRCFSAVHRHSQSWSSMEVTPLHSQHLPSAAELSFSARRAERRVAMPKGRGRGCHSAGPSQL